MDVQKEQEQQNRTDHVVSGFAFYSEKDVYKRQVLIMLPGITGQRATRHPRKRQHPL